MSKYPSERDCLRILTDAGCTKRVLVHCCTVRAVADEIAVKFVDADKELVTAGALLHDLGRAYDHSILHAMVGADMAKDLKLPNELVEIIRKHTGAGLDQQDVDELNLPKGDYIPRTIEEKIVAHADNLVSDNRIVVHSFSSEKLRKKGSVRGADRLDALHKELSIQYGCDLDVMVDMLGEFPELRGPCSQFGGKRF